MKISLHSVTAAAAALLVHAILIAVFISGLSEQKTVAPEIPPIVVQLIQEQQSVKPLPVQPPPEPTPVKPVTPPLPAPQQPEPVRPAPPVQTAPASPVAPAVPTTKTEPVPAPVVAAPPPPPAPPAPPPPVVQPAPPAPPAAVTSPAPPAPAAPIKTGVSVTASYSASNVKPAYPSMSKRLNEQGTVVLRVHVKSDGTAGAVEVKSSSGFPRLDQAAIDAVKTWRFNPATSDGKPVDEWYQVPIPFKLQGSSN